MLLTERLAQKAPHAPKRVERDADLSAAELGVLDGLARSLTYKQIAADLGRSPSTVRTHLHNVYTKLGVIDRAQAVLEADRRGLINRNQNGHRPEGPEFERTATSPVLDAMKPEPRARHLAARHHVAEHRLRVAVPRPYLPEAESDGETPKTKEGALADVLIALHLKGVDGTEASLAAAYEQATGPSGQDRYGKLVRLAAEAMSAATRVKALTGR